MASHALGFLDEDAGLQADKVVNSLKPGKSWETIAGLRSLLTTIMDCDFAKGCAEIVLRSSFVTTELMKRAKSGGDPGRVVIPSAP